MVLLQVTWYLKLFVDSVNVKSAMNVMNHDVDFTTLCQQQEERIDEGCCEELFVDVGNLFDIPLIGRQSHAQPSTTVDRHSRVNCCQLTLSFDILSSDVNLT